MLIRQHVSVQIHRCYRGYSPAPPIGYAGSKRYVSSLRGSNILAVVNHAARNVKQFTCAKFVSAVSYGNGLCPVLMQRFEFLVRICAEPAVYYSSLRRMAMPVQRFARAFYGYYGVYTKSHQFFHIAVQLYQFSIGSTQTNSSRKLRIAKLIRGYISPFPSITKCARYMRSAYRPVSFAADMPIIRLHGKTGYYQRALCRSKSLNKRIHICCAGICAEASCPRVAPEQRVEPGI